MRAVGKGRVVTVDGELGNGRVKFIIKKQCGRWNWREKEAGRSHHRLA